MVIEEIFRLNGGLDMLNNFMRRGGSMVARWMASYWGQTPEELKLSKEQGAPRMRGWLEFFRICNSMQ